MIRLGLSGLAVAALLLFAPVAQVSAGIPPYQLKGAIDRVVKTLEDPVLKGDGKVADRRRAVRKVADDIFDFQEISRRALARHWQTLNDKQREEFVMLFADLLERSYISKIELYGGEKILYANERIDGDVATVGTRIITKNGTDVPVDYRMLKRGPRWMVYDVNIEGVSLVSNYRTQFNKIIQTASYDELVHKLKTKQDELIGDDQKKSTPPKK
jgi:phospholipid transport system substrate-binding protein